MTMNLDRNTEVKHIDTHIAPWSIIFFVILLAAIVFLPCLHPFYLRYTPSRFHRYYIWDSNWKKFLIAIILSVFYFIYLLSVSTSMARSMFLFSLHSLISLFALLSALFITCTGLPIIQLPSIIINKTTTIHELCYVVAKNVLFLAMGTILCNCIGTLAASVLLFPSFISQNINRLSHLNTQRHLTIFFIILIGNCGGVLSPLGDPPLYMGYTNGVPFLFTFKHLYKIFLIVNGYTLIVFGIIDLLNALSLRKSSIDNADELTIAMTEISNELPSKPKDIGSSQGIHNLPFLLIILCLIVLKGLNIPTAWPVYLQESLLFLITVVCISVDMCYHRLSPVAWYKKNYQTRMEPVVEVIVIFVGLLFMMSAPITILTTHANIDIGPKVLFFISGIFSALLDNAAVYISFAANAAARYNITIEQTTIDDSGSTVGFLYSFLHNYPTDATILLRALSAGSVLMGGCTLIGNAPNIVVAFMATRYTYRTRTKLNYMERVGFLRQMFTACFVLTPIFLIVAFLMI